MLSSTKMHSASAFLQATPLRMVRAVVQPQRICLRRAPRAEFARSAALVDGLNADFVRELAVLAVSFGTVTDDLAVLQSVRATAVTEAGIALEAVMCDERGLCVCALETLKWPSGAVANADEAVSALRAMVDSAGLDGAVLAAL